MLNGNAEKNYQLNHEKFDLKKKRGTVSIFREWADGRYWSQSKYVSYFNMKMKMSVKMSPENIWSEYQTLVKKLRASLKI